MQVRAGLIGGTIGGIIKLILDQLTYTIGISTMDSVGDFSRVLFGTKQANWATWVVYLIVAGLVGLLISSLIPVKNKGSYILSGIIIGVVAWILMNIVLIASGVVIPTWSMGVGSLLIDLITHIIFGLSVTFTIWRCKERTTSE